MEEDDSEDDVFNPYLFIANLPPHVWVATKGEARLPPQIKERRTLVLDLDETLVHCSVDPISKPDLTFPVRFNGIFYEVYVRKRPYLDYFLETVSKTFEVRHCYLFSLRRMFFWEYNSMPCLLFYFIFLFL